MNSDPLILPHHPECMSPEVLTKLLVQHQKLQQQIVSGFVNGSRSGDRLHVLLVGAPGVGKTHIVSLICHRLSRQPDLQHITNALPPADAATAILHRIVQQLQHRSLLLVHENLHLVFHSLTDAEQKHWRAFLQETRRFSTLATAPALFPQISDRNRPCFGFFDIHHLQSLKLAASRQLVRPLLSHSLGPLPTPELTQTFPRDRKQKTGRCSCTGRLSHSRFLTCRLLLLTHIHTQPF
jgi:hypothetical protein